MKKAVRNIQTILNKNGYDAGIADGVMGDKTKVAIAAFQKDNGMERPARSTRSWCASCCAKEVIRRPVGRCGRPD